MSRLRTALRAKPGWWLVAVLVLLSGLAAQIGAMPIGVADWLALPKLFGLSGFDDSTQVPAAGSHVLFNLRLPRLLLSLLVGASLGLSGALTQGLFRNPLAEPGLLGVSAGAACAAAITIVLLGEVTATMAASVRVWLLPFAAFVGALTVCFALDHMARWLAPGSISALLLTGIAMNALAGALIGLCTYLADDEQLRNLSFWTLGSLAGAQWLWVGLFATLLTLGYFRLTRLRQSLNALALGDAAARQVGVDIHSLRKQIIVWVALLAGLAVAFCGMISFVGLIAPHLVRLWVGPDQRRMLPLAMLVGAILLLVADTFARSIAVPAEIPVGIFTALVGGPFFLLLVRQTRGRIRGETRGQTR
jgi:iron complex transport system permease protein